MVVPLMPDVLLDSSTLKCRQIANCRHCCFFLELLHTYTRTYKAHTYKAEYENRMIFYTLDDTIHAQCATFYCRNKRINKRLFVDPFYTEHLIRVLTLVVVTKQNGGQNS